MLCSLIGFGRWNKYYYHIIISSVFRFLKDDILGLSTDYQVLTNLKISRHPIMILLLGFISELIISAILIIYQNHKNKQKKKQKIELDLLTKNSEIDQNFKELKNDTKFINSISDIRSEKEVKPNTSDSELANKYKLIYNDIIINQIKLIKKNSRKFIVFSSCLIIIKEFMIKILYRKNDILDSYFVNLIIIAIILRFYFKQKIYRHQKFTIIFSSLISILFLIISIFTSSFQNMSYTIYKIININLSIKYSAEFIIVFIIIYIVISISFCSGIILQKNLLHVRFFSYKKILFWKGLLGIILCIIGLIISSNVPCKTNQNFDLSSLIENVIIKNNTYYIDYNYYLGLNEAFLCTNSYNNNTYFDNFFSYFEYSSTPSKNSTTNKNNKNSTTGIIAEIFILLGYFIFHYISELSLVLVNIYLTPIHYLITESLPNFMHIIFEIILIHISNKNVDDFDENNILQSLTKDETTRYLKLIVIFILILGYLIYLEIINLNFCGLSKDITKNIEERARIDFLDIEIDNNDEDPDINLNDLNNSSDEANHE